MESKKVDLDSSFHAVDFGLKKKNSSLCQWKLYSGFQSLVRFRIPWVVFQANISQIAGKSGLPHMRRNFKSCLVLTYIITCVQITAQIKVVVIRELKQQTFAIHGGQPELKLHKSCHYACHTAVVVCRGGLQWTFPARADSPRPSYSMASCDDKDREKSS